jgi:hypothetical protein
VNDIICGSCRLASIPNNYINSIHIQLLNNLNIKYIILFIIINYMESSHQSNCIVFPPCIVCGDTSHSYTFHLYFNTFQASKSSISTPQVSLCSFCQKSDHSSSDHICSRCKAKGHSKFCCTKICYLCNKKHPTSEHKCHKCNMLGHHVGLSCPNSCKLCGKGHRTQEHRCGNCAMEGDHRTANCPNKCEFCGKAHPSQYHVCSVCKQIGQHRGKDCEERCAFCYKKHRTGDHECKICNIRGDHISVNCPQVNTGASLVHISTQNDYNTDI